MFSVWVAPVIALVGVVVAAWIGATNRRTLAQLQRQAQVEAQLSEKRHELYTEIMEPFIVIMTTDGVWNADPKTKGKDKLAVASKVLLSMKYRHATHRLTFIGTDEVVKALNNVMQHFYKGNEIEDAQELRAHHADIMDKIGNLLLAIRRGAGNDETKLDRWAMLEPFLTDAREQREARQQN